MPSKRPSGTLAAICRPMALYFSSNLPGNRQDRHVQLAQSWPQRGLSAGPGLSQAARQSRGCVRQPIRTLFVVDDQPGEQRLGKPFVEEDFDADLLDVVGQLDVAGAASCSIAFIGDPGRSTDDSEPAYQVGVHQRGVDAQSAAEAVADVYAESTRGGQQVGRLAQVDPHIDGLAMAGDIDDDGLVTVRCKAGRDRLPRVGRLGETVDEHQPRAFPARPAGELPGDLAGQRPPVRHWRFAWRRHDATPERTCRDPGHRAPSTCRRTRTSAPR